jgi:transcriptional regulator with XRE-family HTH domain
VIHRREKTEHLKSNIKYLIKSRGETQLSLCSAAGLTRTTIYNILEGKVINVQQSTIRKISDFFGVSYDEIETIDFEAKEIIESSVSPQGNMNPAAVPILKESLVIQNLDKRIGELATVYPLTYYFGTSHNLIAVRLEHAIPGINEPGDVLIVQKGSSSDGKEKLVYDRATKRMLITLEACAHSDRLCVVGDIIEERFNDNA